MKFAVLAAAAAVTASPQPVSPGTISTPTNDYNLTEAPDGTRVFARSEADFRNARIFVQPPRGTPAPIAFTDPRWSDSDPHLSVDGRELTFVSTRPLPGRPASQDLKARLLPAPVNSAASDSDYSEHPSGRAAVFWSDRPGGLGGGDLYVVPIRADGYGTAVNLGATVNSAGFEITPQFSPDGSTLFFASDRSGGLGLQDLYSVRVADVPALAAALRDR